MDVDFPIRDRRLAKQIAELQAANMRLTKDISMNENQDRLASLEKLVEEKMSEIKRLGAENKQLEKMHREQDKDLLRLADPDEIPNEVRRFKDEIRSLTEQVAKADRKNARDDEEIARQHDRLMELTSECKQVVDVLKSKGIDPQEQMDIEEIKEEIRVRGETIAALEKQHAVLERARRADERKYQGKLDEQRTSIDILQGEVSRARRM